jgi:hypothetical protein
MTRRYNKHLTMPTQFLCTVSPLMRMLHEVIQMQPVPVQALMCIGHTEYQNLPTFSRIITLDAKEHRFIDPDH